MLKTGHMESYETILVLGNEFEAERMEEVLKDQQIPYGIVPIGDSVLGGIVGIESGWGYLKAPSRYGDKIREIYRALRNDAQFI